MFTSNSKTSCHHFICHTWDGRCVTVGQHTLVHTLLVNRTNSLFENQPCHYKIIMCLPLPTDTTAGLFCTLTAECMVNENVVKEPGYQPVWCHQKAFLLSHMKGWRNAAVGLMKETQLYALHAPYNQHV